MMDCVVTILWQLCLSIGWCSAKLWSIEQNLSNILFECRVTVPNSKSGMSNNLELGLFDKIFYT
jgi:hypothetical protein